jgi:hypothetical protein
LSKHSLVSERDYDTLLDHLLTLNDETPYIKVGPDHPLNPDVVFGLDTKLFEKTAGEKVDWEKIGGDGSHGEEIETKSVWRGGGRPGGQGKRKRAEGHVHAAGESCGCMEEDRIEVAAGEVVPLELAVLEEELRKLSFEIYRGMSGDPAPKSLIRPSPRSKSKS